MSHTLLGRKIRIFSKLIKLFNHYPTSSVSINNYSHPLICGSTTRLFSAITSIIRIAEPNNQSLVVQLPEGQSQGSDPAPKKERKKRRSKATATTSVDDPTATSTSTPTSKKKKNKKRTPKSSEALLASVTEGLGVKFLEKYGTRFTLTSHPHGVLEELLPHQCKKIATNIPTSTYLVDQAVAKEFVNLVKAEGGPELQDKDSPIIELSPGLGILTSELFSTLGFKRVTGLEESGIFAKFLTTRRDYSSKLTLVEKGLPEFPKLYHVDKVDGGSRISNLLTQVKLEPQSAKKSNLLIFGALPHQSLVHFIIRCLTTGRVLYDEDWGWADPVYYVVLGSKPRWILTSGPSSGYFSYRPTSVLFQLLFKYKALGELPRSAWIPWANESSEENNSKRNNFRHEHDPTTVYLVKLQTNEDVVSRIGRDKLVHFWYFVRQHLFSRKKTVIQELEGWIPGCGARLIRQGFTIYTQFGELKPEEILELYLQFASWPEFRGSSFVSAVEKFQSRLDVPDDD